MSDMRFTKAQGMGNDFLIIEVAGIAELPNAGQLALQMCERNYGAGADGIVFVGRSDSEDADFASRIFNADGSEAEIRIATAAGVKHGRLVSREGTRFKFEFDMGRPALSSEAVPMTPGSPLEQVVQYPLRLGGDLLEVTCMSMGNPQCVIFVNDFDGVNLEEIGPLIEHHPIFPDRANGEFARVVSPGEIEIRIWERGAGHTLSSGTGSCASAVAAALNGLTDRIVRVAPEGGNLRVNWQADDRVMLTASAEVIYEGRWLQSDRVQA